mmetsp:Transcript_31439/g.73429  ORF Transcript_31439/g.73429 Transcript_31439/m.73429 type:complete len:303 (+) Transcript_31439:950-1858(+)
MIRTDRWLVSRINTSPASLGDVELKEVVEVVTILLSVAPKEEDAISAYNSLRSRTCRRGTAVDRIDTCPAPRADIVLVDVILSSILIGASHEVEAVVPNHNCMTSSGSVHLIFGILSRLSLHFLPGPHILWHQSRSSILRIAYGAASAAACCCTVPHRGWCCVIGLGIRQRPSSREVGPRSELYSVHVVQATSVEPTQDVHVSLMYDRLVKRPGRWLNSSGVHLCPIALREVVLVEVGKPVLRLVYTTKGEHRVSTDHCCVTVACPRRLTTKLQLNPHIGRSIVLKQLLQGLVPVPTSKHVH